MHKEFLTPRRVGAVALALALSVLGAAPAGATSVDLLSSPALSSPRAASALLLGIARAGDRLVAVGERGTVLLSDDNGRSWHQAAQVPVSVALTAVYFADDKQGWAVGHSGVVLHSADGGNTWTRQLDGTQAAQIALDAAKLAVEQGGGNPRRVGDAERLVADGPDKPFLGVRFLDAQHGFVVGAYGLAFETEDGGATWHSIMERIADPRGRHLYAVVAEGRRLLVAGEQGALFLSEDRGAHFAPLASPYQGTYFGALPAVDGQVVVYGLRGNLYHEDALGGAWQKVASAHEESLVAGTRLADGALLLVDEAGRLLRSTDGGASFAELAVPKAARYTGITQAADQALVLSSVRGPVRIDPADLKTESKQ